MELAASPPARLLIVAGSPALRETLLSLLTWEGYAPTAVTSLEEALAAVEKSTYALILADLYAGKSRHSFTSAHILRRHTPCPIGLFTPEQVSPWDERWGVFAFLLAQPLDPTQLLTEVATCLNRLLSPEQARQAEVVRRLVEALADRRWRTLRSLCTPDIRYAPPTSLLGVPAPLLEGQRALTAYASSVWQGAPALRLEVIALYHRPRGLALRYMRVAPTSDDGWAWQAQTEVFAFVGDQICQIGLPESQQPLPEERSIPQVG